VVSALAKVGLVWAVAVLGALFMVTSAQGQPDEGHSASATSRDAPRTAGLALALVVLGSGITVLAVGATAGERNPDRVKAVEPDPATDLSLALGLGLLP
jgi:Mn2+/Fe2+ NRAMP family transporter